ncbi:MAG: T9SS type A sorting domain-containing protein [Balneolaceae bacterium]|nr:T9SS type A sorting domain-containing protein [Balneolaceae bacterium]
MAQVWDARTRSFRLLTPQDARLEAWEGFLVQNREASSLEIPESAQLDSGDPAPGGMEETPRISFRLNGRGPGGETVTDRAAEMVFGEEASHGWDAMDATKLRPLSDRWATLSLVGQRGGRSVYKARESRPRNLKGGLSIPLEVRTRGFSGTMELGWSMEGLPENWELRLTDRLNGRQIDLRSRDAYEFEQRAEGPVTRQTEGELRRPDLQMPAPDAGDQPRFTLSVRVPVGPQVAEEETPESVRLNPMYPNPFSSSTTIPFELSENAHVRITVWNTIGAKVATLVDRPMEIGEHRQTWTPSNLPQGIYRIMLEVDGRPFSRPVTYINP